LFVIIVIHAYLIHISQGRDAFTVRWDIY